MIIIEEKYNFKSSPGIRRVTSQIILHHAAANCTPQEIHKWHLNNGWTGIGYHFVIAKDGSVFRGRAENWVGSHASSNNSNSIGICFVGNFENESPTTQQIVAGKELVSFLISKYGKISIKGHRDVNSTSCPGKNFPMGEFTGVAAGGSANSVPASSGGSNLLKVGSRGEEVRQIQQRLIAIGYDLGQFGADGVFGNKTDLAIRNFQQKSGLVVDGIVGEKTKSALLSSNTIQHAPPVEKLNNYPGYLIKQGDSGEVVRKIQNRLLQLTYTSLGSADGIFGGKTTIAVKNFQKNRGLAIDGIVGEKTWSVLFG